MFLKLLTSLFLISSVHASVVEEGFFVFDKDGINLKLLSSHKEITIDHKNTRGYEVYGPKGLGIYLNMLSIDHEELSEMIEGNKDLNGYPTPEEIEVKLKQLAKGNESFLKLFSLGKTHQGRELWMIKLSDNVELNEVEPEVKYIANMHGNEIVGRELMVSLLEELVTKYKAGDKEITELINNSEVFIMPSMNPDGAMAKRRGNAQWTDLNRDFPDFTTNDNTNDYKGREPETQAVMKFQAKHKIALSANFHGGSVVVNYPWDTHSDDAPLTSLIVDLSKEYAFEVSDMRNSNRFQDGIVNGFRWYHVDGGMQDWSYFYYNDLQVTIELSDHKWPNYIEIPTFYEENRVSLIKYLARVHQGAGFYFKEGKKEKGSVEIIRLKTLPTASIIPVGTYPFSDGEFYKVLPEGDYQFKITLDNGQIKSMKAKVQFRPDLENGNYLAL
jgi:predicted deacylase